MRPFTPEMAIRAGFEWVTFSVRSCEFCEAFETTILLAFKVDYCLVPFNTSVVPEQLLEPPSQLQLALPLKVFPDTVRLKEFMVVIFTET
ncbi:MAG: hypothetical protein HW382_1112 [Deltaproteobacteria bacterium]|nr:hypothetical protein [Deltaproteobacteria bacterium]